MAFTVNKKAFCVLEFAKTESVVTVQRRFRIMYHTEPPTDKPFGVGSTVTGYVTCQHGDGRDVAVSVWVVLEQGMWLHCYTLAPRKHILCDMFFMCGGCARCWNSCTLMCSAWGKCSFSVKSLRVERNVWEKWTNVTRWGAHYTPIINQQWENGRS